MFIILHLGMCWDTLLMIKSLWFRLDIKLFRWTFHSWDSSIWMPRSLVCCVLLMIVSPTLISVRGWVKACFSFRRRNSVLFWLATRPLDAIKLSTLFASASSLDLISSLSLLLLSVVVSSAKLNACDFTSQSSMSAV